MNFETMCAVIIIVVMLMMFGSLTYLAVTVEHNLVYAVCGLCLGTLGVIAYAAVKVLNVKE
jgi:hypothetical protein